MSYNPVFYDEARPEDKQRSFIASAVFLLLIIVALVLPFLSTVYPIPEAEGLMVSFGDVPTAGGDNPNTNVAPTPQPDNPTEDKVTTIDDPDNPKIDKPDDNTAKPNPNPNPSPTPKVDDNLLFNNDGNPGGKGNGTGSGQQGDPTGRKDDLGGTGRGDQGNGTGEIGNRSIKSKCTNIGSGDQWAETGTAWVYVCVDESGKVVSAEFAIKTQRGQVSDITSASQKRIAVECAKQYQYDPAPGKGTACGSIPIYFRNQ